jgi:hypothetical protein
MSPVANRYKILAHMFSRIIRNLDQISESRKRVSATRSSNDAPPLPAALVCRRAQGTLGRQYGTPPTSKGLGALGDAVFYAHQPHTRRMG